MSLRLRRLASAFVLALPMLGGCNNGSKPVTMADSFDLDIFGPHVDDLHTPYVAGAAFGISVSAPADADQTGWTLSSSDPNVFRVTSPLSGGSANVQAANPGQATLSVLDATGKVIDSHPVSVEIPDQVSLYAEGLLLTGAPDGTAQVTSASVVSGGEATFLVRYFTQGTELYGSGALQSTATSGITTDTASESFATARDFLQITVPANDGVSGSVSLLIDNVSVGEIPITTVNASTVTQVSLLAQSTNGAQTGASLTLYAHAVDATAADVFGASFDWSIVGQLDGGQPTQGFTPGPADLFFYNYDPTATETVTASYDGFSRSTTVQGQGGSVGSSADVPCSIAGELGMRTRGSAPRIVVAITLAALLGAAARRRRRAQASAWRLT